jgi:parvulin-like peptidyl-prolyl isomerase
VTSFAGRTHRVTFGRSRRANVTSKIAACYRVTLTRPRNRPGPCSACETPEVRSAEPARYHPLGSMKSPRSILALGAFFVLAAGLSACGSGVSGNAVADMAGNPIPTTAFNHWMYVAAKGNAAQSAGAPVIVPTDPPDFKGCIAQARKLIPTLAKIPDKQLKSDCGQLFTSLGSQVMDFLVKAYWYQAEAAKQHINVTDTNVQQAFNTAKQQQFPTDAAFQSFLSQSGQTMQDILFRVRVNQIFRKLLAKHSTPVTSAQIQSYYQSHLSQYGSPQSRDIRIVRTNSLKQANAAKAALSRGQSWNAVAKKYSIDAATKTHGGLLAGVTKSQVEQTLATAAFSAPLTKVLGPVQGTFGVYIFEVTKIKRSTQRTLAQATPLIRQLLNGQAQTSAQSAVDNQAKSNWLHKTNCRAAWAMADCSGYKAPKTSTSTTAAPSTTTP